MARQILPTVDLRTPEQRQGLSRSQALAQSLKGIMQTLGASEQKRREREQLDRIVRAIGSLEKGDTMVQAIATAAGQEPTFGTGFRGGLQRLAGAFRPSPGGVQQGIQQSIVGAGLKQALAPKFEAPSGEFAQGTVTQRSPTGKISVLQELGKPTKRTKADALLKQIDKKIALGTLKEGSVEHLRLLGVSGDKIKTPEDRLKFWQTVLQKTKDAIGTTFEGQESTATLASEKIDEALNEIKKSVVSIPPKLTSNAKGQVTAVGGQVLDEPVSLEIGRALSDLVVEIQRVQKAGKITEEELRTITVGIERDPSKAPQILEILKKR